jgi:ribonuclease J
MNPIQPGQPKPSPDSNKTRVYRNFSRPTPPQRSLGDQPSITKTVRFNAPKPGASNGPFTATHPMPSAKPTVRAFSNASNGPFTAVSPTLAGATPTSRLPQGRPVMGRPAARSSKPTGFRPPRGKGFNRSAAKHFDPPAFNPESEGIQQQMISMGLIPDVDPGVIRIIPLCGVEWIGTNMTALEYGDDIIVIDAGFGFKNPDTPGINYTIPDVAYLESRKDKIRALVITHGHMDHVGGIPYIIERIGNPPIYTREFGAIFIKKRMEEFPHVPTLDIRIVAPDVQYITISDNLRVKFFGLTHSIPDSTGVIIQTPFGGIVSTGDVRVENIDGVPSHHEVDQYKFFKDEKILLCTMDSTGAPVPGWAGSEQLVLKSLDSMIANIPGRIILGTFSSQVERLVSLLHSAKAHGRYVVIEGRSMKSNMEIAKFLNLGIFDHVISPEEMHNHPPNKILCLITGAQGEQFSGLQRVSTGTHKSVKLNPSDTVILSSSVIPGNDFPIDKLKDDLFRTGATVLTYVDNMVHSSGHGKREELRWLHSQIPYTFFMPVHGRHWFLHMHKKISLEKGTPNENIIIPENGSIIELYDNGSKIRKLPMKAVNGTYVVDGSYVGPLHTVVMEDRLALASNGMFTVVVTIDGRSRTLLKAPDIISRGFVYLRESRDLLIHIRTIIKKTCEAELDPANGDIDVDVIKKVLAEKIYKYLLQKTQKEPVIIPVVVVV